MYEVRIHRPAWLRRWVLALGLRFDDGPTRAGITGYHAWIHDYITFENLRVFPQVEWEKDYGVREAFEAMVAGKLNCTVECNPLIGPQLFDAVEAVVAGKTVPKRITVEEGVFDQSQAKAALPNRKY